MNNVGVKVPTKEKTQGLIATYLQTGCYRPLKTIHLMAVLFIFFSSACAGTFVTPVEIASSRSVGGCSVDCGDGTTCPDEEPNCCGDAESGRCCGPNHPHWCVGTENCYRTIQDVINACGDNWKLCGRGT